MDILLGRMVGKLRELLLLTLCLLSLLKLGYVEPAALSAKYSEQRWVLPKVIISLKNIQITIYYSSKWEIPKCPLAGRMDIS